MDRRISNDGFLLAETCLVILGLSILSSLYLSMREVEIDGYWQFGDAYLDEQSEAILNIEPRQYVYEEGVVDINEKGNVANPGTIHFENRKIIVELGGGRLVYR